MKKSGAPARQSGAIPTRQGPFRAAPQREGFYVIVTQTLFAAGMRARGHEGAWCAGARVRVQVVMADDDLRMAL